MNEVLTTIAARRSHRRYRETKLTEEQVKTVLTAALQAPSARNMQPWHFSVVFDRDLLHEMDKSIVEVMGPNPRGNQSLFYEAPCVVFLSADRDNSWALIDCGIAVQNMALAAESIGLGSVILGMPRFAFRSEKADAYRGRLDFPENYDFVIALAIGVPADDKEAHAMDWDKISYVK